MNNNESVDITEVFPSAVRVHREGIEVGDKVFDVWGGTHTVIKVQRFKAHTTCRREDGEVFVVAGDETLTIIKKEA